jgi:hypothetical protein
VVGVSTLSTRAASFTQPSPSPHLWSAAPLRRLSVEELGPNL